MSFKITCLTFLMPLLFFWQQSYAQEDSLTVVTEQEIDSLTFVDHAMELFEFKVGSLAMSVYPILAYSPASGWQLGVMPLLVYPSKRGYEDISRVSTTSGSITYSTNNWFESMFDTKLYGKKYDFYNLLEASVLQETFFGVGLKHNTDVVSLYQTAFINIKGNVYSHRYEKLFLGLTYDFNSNQISEVQGDLLNESVLGYKGGLVFGLGPLLVVDQRDQVDYPTKGNFIQVGAKYYPSIDRQNYQYWNYLFDIRYFFDLKRDWVFATQFYTELTNGRTPFYKLPRLAGREFLRGFSHRSKFINDNVSYLQAEFRKHLFWRLGFVAFAGVGNTFAEVEEIDDHIKYVGGFGARFQLRTDSKINFRADVGFGSNGDNAIFITVREAF